MMIFTTLWSLFKKRLKLCRAPVRQAQVTILNASCRTPKMRYRISIQLGRSKTSTRGSKKQKLYMLCTVGVNWRLRFSWPSTWRFMPVDDMTLSKLLLSRGRNESKSSSMLFRIKLNFLRKLIRLRRTKIPNESMMMYFLYKSALLTPCGQEPKHAVQCIVGGIKNESIKASLRMANFQDAVIAKIFGNFCLGFTLNFGAAIRTLTLWKRRKPRD